jgi:hypothetical protein
LLETNLRRISSVIIESITEDVSGSGAGFTVRSRSVRKRHIYIDKYGPEVGSKLYHALQSQAAHAGVSARLRRKLDALTGGKPWPPARVKRESMPLFPELELQAAATGPDEA